MNQKLLHNASGCPCVVVSLPIKKKTKYLLTDKTYEILSQLPFDPDRKENTFDFTSKTVFMPRFPFFSVLTIPKKPVFESNFGYFFPESFPQLESTSSPQPRE